MGVSLKKLEVTCFLRSSIAASEDLSSAREPRSVTRAAGDFGDDVVHAVRRADSTMPVLMMSPMVRTRTTSSSNALAVPCGHEVVYGQPLAAGVGHISGDD